MTDTSLSNPSFANSSFQDKLTRLETIHNQLKEMETTDLALLIALYQEGTILSKELNQTLTHFEQKIIEIDAIQVDAPSLVETDAPLVNSPSTIDTPIDTNSDKSNTDSSTITHYVADLFSDIEDEETE